MSHGLWSHMSCKLSGRSQQIQIDDAISVISVLCCTSDAGLYQLTRQRRVHQSTQLDGVDTQQSIGSSIIHSVQEMIESTEKHFSLSFLRFYNYSNSDWHSTGVHFEIQREPRIWLSLTRWLIDFSLSGVQSFLPAY